MKKSINKTVTKAIEFTRWNCDRCHIENDREGVDIAPGWTTIFNGPLSSETHLCCECTLRFSSFMAARQIADDRARRQKYDEYNAAKCAPAIKKYKDLFAFDLDNTSKLKKHWWEY